uniref:ribosomal protein L9 n=1 Tax=Hypnea pseudomusciformis TaxID=1545697 RepID=UPI0027DAB03D|nr:ribosomal protein L9 [Hypnea pseudomusciformis]WCH55209.1 ribosomal protein L9 [Hypnea pseudomusciformis]WCH56802.1 ribosomal protein L9 [Hypnea pseudomusciformis]
MNKKITMILRDEKDKNQQQIIQVTRGYAFNYLIPQGIAEIATPGKLKHINMLQEKQKQKIQINKEKANLTSKYLSTINKITITKKHGNKMQIFGQINEKDISNKIIEYTGYTLNKKQINIPNIKTIGKYQITIKLLKNLESYISLNVIPEIIENNINFN